MTGLVLSVLLAVLPASSDGGVAVAPGPHEAQLRLEGDRVSRPRGTEFVHTPTTPATPTFTPIVACREDEVVGIYGCSTEAPPEAADDPELTPGDVLRAVREIGLPSLAVKMQPGGRTLVNVETIFYTEPQPFERSVQLLGFDVDVVAEPAGYRWVHGDGTTSTTTDPGRPYPAMDVTHRYSDPADGLQASVDVTYRVRFRVDDGPWQSIAQTLVASGPVAAVDVKEAAPVLAKP